ncbi:hypothetical protein HAX54_029123 [Datura stramonium]|uniref:MYB transcription factor n=1 Tax=Datura stramonium TaxID=4076 RepID=A0ABS8SA29_DATST|nr:hypothetical protein [Datura stramonium]
MGAPKQKWTSEEEAALKAGVAKYGVGKWSTILKDPEFAAVLRSRSNVDLKDKWRNLHVMASGWGSRHRGRVVSKSVQPTPKHDDNTLVSSVGENDIEVLDAKPLAPSGDVLKDVGSKKPLSRLDDLILEAIAKLKEPRGSSRNAISSYIEVHLNADTRETITVGKKGRSSYKDAIYSSRWATNETGRAEPKSRHSCRRQRPLEKKSAWQFPRLRRNSDKQRGAEPFVDHILSYIHNMQPLLSSSLSLEEVGGYSRTTNYPSTEKQERQGMPARQDAEISCLQTENCEEESAMELYVDSNKGKNHRGECSNDAVSVIDNPLPLQINDSLTEKEIEDKASLWVQSNVLKLCQLFGATFEGCDQVAFDLFLRID